MNTCEICKAAFTPKRAGQMFCSVACRQANNGAGRRGQKTGRRKDAFAERMTKDGYLRAYAAHHPFANGRKEMHVHQMVMELHLGRALTDAECVHHINGDKTDNRLENMTVVTRSDHSSAHMAEIVKNKSRKAGRFA